MAWLIGGAKNAWASGAEQASLRWGRCSCRARQGPEEVWLPLPSGHRPLCGEPSGRQGWAAETDLGERPWLRRGRGK